jgi:hypothetical protein
MTVQIPDLFLYNNTKYSVAEISEGKLFDPAILGLNPSGANTACWRGYELVCSVIKTHLVVADLHINLFEEREEYHRKQGPTINGVTPTSGVKGKDDFFNNHYYGLNYPLKYSGGLLLANDFNIVIPGFYFLSLFRPMWGYKDVIELIFENGVLLQEFDRSETMNEVRQMLIESCNSESSNPMPSDDEISDFFERAFDQTYASTQIYLPPIECRSNISFLANGPDFFESEALKTVSERLRSILQHLPPDFDVEGLLEKF